MQIANVFRLNSPRLYTSNKVMVLGLWFGGKEFT